MVFFEFGVVPFKQLIMKKRIKNLRNEITRRTTMSERKQVFARNYKFKIKITKKQVIYSK